MRIAFLIATLLSLSIPQAFVCPWDPSFVSSSAKPLPPAKFRAINRTMSVPDIIEQLGPAARDVGSGLYVLQWDVADGRTFFVSTSSACDKPANMGFNQAGANNSFKPNPIRGPA